INSIMQTVLYAPLAIFYLNIFSDPHQEEFTVSFWEVCRSVLIFLGIPLLAGIFTRYGVIIYKGRTWLDEKFLPTISPIALAALIYTILILFALQGSEVVRNIGNVVRVSFPMFLYFGLMWFGTLFILKKNNCTYEYAVTQSFTASSNNFELAIAISVGTFGVKSQEALAATVGPLIEVPVLLILVHVALWLRHRLAWLSSQGTMNLEMRQIR
ncbi:MAG: arsenic resistance protein, partial [Bacteroidia bacterium]